jgi:hypothetical protein
MNLPRRPGPEDYLSKKAIRDIVEDEASRNRAYATRLREIGQWDAPRLRAMTTEEIVETLRSFGVPLDLEEFTRELHRLLSAEAVSDQWWDRHPVTATGKDEDFLFEAALALRERLLPDLVTSEVLDDWMQEGYDLLESKRETEACDRWLLVWDGIKGRMAGTGHRAQDADRVVRGLQSVFNWSQDLEGELWNAGLKDRRFWEERLRYVKEFTAIFSKEEDLLPNFLRAEAETLWALGKMEEAEARFRALVERFPRRAWGYVGWADEYWLWSKSAKDYTRAEGILQEALRQPGLDDPRIIHERLMDLYTEWGKPEQAARHRRGSGAPEVQQAPQSGSAISKVGRNDPCPCGSGKKFKRCCGA